MRTVICVILSIFLSVPALLAQDAGTVTVRLNAADLKGRTLNLDMDIRINHVHVNRRQSLSLTLALKKGDNVLYLPAVIINGANKRKMYERAVNLVGLDAARGDAYAVLKNDVDVIQFLPYQKDVDYQSWMNRSELLLIGEVLDYNNKVIDSFTDTLEKSLHITAKGNSTTRQRTQTNAPAILQQPAPQQQQPAQSTEPVDKVQQYLQRQQQQQQPQQQQQQPQTQQRQQQTPPPLQYRQGEYPSQQIRK